MASLRTLNPTSTMNTIGNTTRQTAATARSVLNKLKTLSSNEILDPLESLSDSKSISIGSRESTWKFIKHFLQYFFILLILAFILLNILAYFGLLPKLLADIFRPILIFFGYNIGETIRQTSDISEEGTKSLATAISQTVDAGVDILEEKSTLENESTIKELDNDIQNPPEKGQEPEPIETDSQSQRIGSKKTGFCYIGEDRGFRSCIEVDKNDECVSGDIFPTQDICINPNLRQ